MKNPGSFGFQRRMYEGRIYWVISGTIPKNGT